MKRIIHYLAVILLSMSMASCPEPDFDSVSIGIDNQSQEEVAIGVVFYSEYRKQKYMADYGADISSLFWVNWRIPKETKFRSLCIEPFECNDWKTFFAEEGIDTLTIVLSRKESAISQWIESHADSLLLCRRDFTLDALGASNNHLDIVIDDSLHVTMKPSIYPHPW